jgi:hypothetical protein
MYNLAGIVMVVSWGRLVAENFLKYGILLKLPSGGDGSLLSILSPAMICLLCLPLFLVAAHAIETAALQETMFPRTCNRLRIANGLLCMCIPTVVIRGSAEAFLPGVVLIMVAVVQSMKLLSFSHVMYAAHRRVKATSAPMAEEPEKETGKDTGKSNTRSGLRNRAPKANTKSPSIPVSTENVSKPLKPAAANAMFEFALEDADLPPLDALDTYTWHHLAYFMAAPTLCFQFEYSPPPFITQQSDSITQQSDSITQRSDSIIQQSDSITQQSDSLAQKSDSITQHSDSITQHGDSITQHSDSITQRSDSITQRSDSITQRSDSITQHGDSITQHSDSITQQSDSITQHALSLYHTA